jgi:putative transposase
VSVACFIASQRTEYRVPHAKCCRWLGVSESWFYKWHDRPPTARQRRRAALDEAVKASFDDSGGTPGTYGSPRVFEDLVEAGWRVSVNTVAASMARQGLQGRSPKRKRRCLTRPDKAAAPIPDLVKRDFRAQRVDQRWCGDLTEIPTDEPRFYLLVTWNQRAGWIITDRHRDHELRGPVAREHRGEVAGPGSARASRGVAHDLDQPGPRATHHRRVRARARGVRAGL